jgi:hypothetical protein
MESWLAPLILVGSLLVSAGITVSCLMPPALGEKMRERLGREKVANGAVAITAVLLVVGAYGKFAGWWGR